MLKYRNSTFNQPVNEIFHSYIAIVTVKLKQNKLGLSSAKLGLSSAKLIFL